MRDLIEAWHWSYVDFDMIFEGLAEKHLPVDHRFEDDWSDPAPTVEVRLRYSAYHVAYHAGQMYEARHLLGETTPDN